MEKEIIEPGKIKDISICRDPDYPIWQFNVPLTIGKAGGGTYYINIGHAYENLQNLKGVGYLEKKLKELGLDIDVTDLYKRIGPYNKRDFWNPYDDYTLLEKIAEEKYTDFANVLKQKTSSLIGKELDVIESYSGSQFQIKDIRPISIKEAKRRLNEKLLRVAIRNGYLPKGSTVENLTDSIRQRIAIGKKLEDIYLIK